MYKLGIIGVGKMGRAILNGIVGSRIYLKKDILLCVHDDKVSTLLDEGFNVTSSIDELISNSDTILLAIKPQGFKETFNREYNVKAVISILAGINITTIKKVFPKAHITRVMPNTPALIGECVATLCSNDSSSKYFTNAVDIFNSIGVAVEIKESEMDATLPLNGSMPAYLYLFAKSFIESAVKDGINYETAKKLACESIISSAKMIMSSNDTIDTLINNVCSKGGTTIAGLDKLNDGDFTKTIEECFKACKERSIELGK